MRSWDPLNGQGTAVDGSRLCTDCHPTVVLQKGPIQSLNWIDGGWWSWCREIGRLDRFWGGLCEGWLGCWNGLDRGLLCIWLGSGRSDTDLVTDVVTDLVTDLFTGLGVWAGMVASLGSSGDGSQPVCRLRLIEPSPMASKRWRN